MLNPAEQIRKCYVMRYMKGIATRGEKTAINIGCVGM